MERRVDVRTVDEEEQHDDGDDDVCWESGKKLTENQKKGPRRKWIFSMEEKKMWIFCFGMFELLEK